jgi:hypothetical protein
MVVLYTYDIIRLLLFVFAQLKCCGVDTYADFQTYSPNWNRKPEIGGSAVANDLKTPIACCITIPTTNSGVSCAETPTTANNFYTVRLPSQ